MRERSRPTTKVTRHRDARVFLAAARPAYDGDPSTEGLFLHWAEFMAATPVPREDRPSFLSCAGGAALQRPDGPAMIGRSTPEAAEALADAFVRERPHLPGVIGERRASIAFARRWRERTGIGVQRQTRMSEQRLTKVRPVPAPSGSARVAVAADVSWLTAVELAFLAELRLRKRVVELPAAIRTRVAASAMRIWDDGERVACAGYFPAASGTARVAPVYTLRSARGRGYATALVADLARELLAGGCREVYLTADADSPAPNAVYARVGFVPVALQLHLEFSSADDGPGSADRAPRC
jgi:predicted GNAT family acetyltransferase